MNKHAWITVLAGLNLALLAGVLIQVFEPPAAKAQMIGGVNPYLIVTGKAPGGSNAAVWVVDLASRQMFVFQPNMTFDLQPLDRRDLSRDFGRQANDRGR